MAWHLAKSLETLRNQINAKWPDRVKAADGTIGDPAHAQRKSDHNPDEDGAVKALDITHDPSCGCDAGELAEALRQSKDERISYIISNGRISNPNIGGGAWRDYHGSNPHVMHFHLSVLKDGSENPAPWEAVAAVESTPNPEAPGPRLERLPTLKLGSKGEAVAVLQAFLKVKIDGEFGAETEAAVKAAQTKAKILADGVVGPYTWGALSGQKLKAPPKSTKKTASTKKASAPKAKPKARKKK